VDKIVECPGLHAVESRAQVPRRARLEAYRNLQERNENDILGWLLFDVHDAVKRLYFKELNLAVPDYTTVS
jgi:hypothetical protein